MANLALVHARDLHYPVPVGGEVLSIGQTIKSYILWTHPRGGFHYDVMVTVILAFIFLTPRSVFKDSPNYRPQPPNQIIARPDGPNGFVYEFAAASVAPGDSDLQTALKHTLEPVAGNVQITRYEELHSWTGKTTGYRVWAHR
jgi:hypothetical protein